MLQIVKRVNVINITHVKSHHVNLVISIMNYGKFAKKCEIVNCDICHEKDTCTNCIEGY